MWERSIVCYDLYGGNGLVTHNIPYSQMCISINCIAFVLDFNVSVSVFL